MSEGLTPGPGVAVDGIGVVEDEAEDARTKGAVERVMGFEPTTLCLGSKYSTTELHPR